ncbi:hypothetical protein BUALT_Bualt07G0085800 [Buddleja alternifolia]|uniref:Uncharacterized protein n=1 Tax=Buddleja alternifolia TaxID=168488 RepID=A0AAV6XHB3_9LAMI|nr:hypothetical protein BUALT_Bualt07G0085800 [Buddleja alternifolia]
MERPPSKIIKHHSLSIYESTLLKLKQGSHCNPSTNPEDSARMYEHCSMETEEAMTSDADCSSTDCSSFKSTDSSKEQECRNISILYLFSKYKASQQNEQRTNEKEVVMTVESDSSSSCSVSPTSSC